MLAEPRQSRVLVDHADHRDGDGREQDDEAPEDRGVHEAGEQALQQLALADDDHSLSPCAAWQVVEPLHRLAHAHQPVQEDRTAREQRDRDDKDNGEDRRGDRVHLSLRTSAEMAGTISLRSPTTA